MIGAVHRGAGLVQRACHPVVAADVLAVAVAQDGDPLWIGGEPVSADEVSGVAGQGDVLRIGDGGRVVAHRSMMPVVPTALSRGGRRVSALSGTHVHEWLMYWRSSWALPTHV